MRAKVHQGSRGAVKDASSSLYSSLVESSRSLLLLASRGSSSSPLFKGLRAGPLPDGKSPEEMQ